MNPQALPFALAVLSGLLAWGAVSRRYVWPRIKSLELSSGAEPILYVHTFRYIGLSFLPPGVGSATIDSGWARGAAWGDVGAAVLAALALILLRTRAARPAIWLFNVWGTLDLLRAFVDAVPKQVNLSLQATWFIPTFLVPLLLCTHVMLYMLLLRRSAARQGDASAPA